MCNECKNAECTYFHIIYGLLQPCEYQECTRIEILAKIKLTNVVIWFSAILLLKLTYTNGQNRNHIIHRNKMLPLFTRKLETNDSLSTTKGRLNRTLMRNFLHATKVLESPRIRDIIHL